MKPFDLPPFAAIGGRDARSYASIARVEMENVIYAHICGRRSTQFSLHFCERLAFLTHLLNRFRPIPIDEYPCGLPRRAHRIEPLFLTNGGSR